MATTQTPSHTGSPFSTNGTCIHHPTVQLATYHPPTQSYTIERKRCPKCCLQTIIQDTALKQHSNGLGRSSKSLGAKSRYSYQLPGAGSVSCASLPQSFEDPRNFRRDNKNNLLDDSSYSSVGYYSRRGVWNGHHNTSNRSKGGHWNNSDTRSWRDPREIPFRTPKDPSIASSTTRMSRSDTSESPSYRPAVRHRSNGRQRRDNHNPSSSLSSDTLTMGSTIPTADASTCSTITMDTALDRRGRHGGKRRSRQRYEALDPVCEVDSRGRDPDGSHSTSDTNGHVPMQVNVSQRDQEKIILISNMPSLDGERSNDNEAKHPEEEEEETLSRYKRRGDDPSSREDHETIHRQSTRETKSSKRDIRNRDNSPHNHGRQTSSSRHLSPRKNRTYDIDNQSHPSLEPSITSQSSSILPRRPRPSIRHDIDPDGYCSHHPDIRLMKPDEHNDNYWSIVRKKCPKCIREDCPSVFDDAPSITSNYSRNTRGNSTHTPFFHEDEGSMYSIQSSKNSTFFNPQLTTPEEIEEEEDTRRLKRRLAARAYHFPGNTWCEDWFQYISNTHTVLGLFFHHPLHPLKLQERLVILFGSIAIGLTISNMTYMWFIKNGVEVEEELFTVNMNWMNMNEVVITKLMLTLWTLGSFLHTVFDLGLWHMKACTICRYGGQIDERMARWGRVVGLFIVVVAMAVGSYAVLLRASIEYKGVGSEGASVEEAIRNNEFYEIDFGGKRSFRFLLGYLIEFLLAMFVYYPIAVTILFSGVLGCRGRIPILGGRPREIKKERNHAMNKRKMLKTGESGVDDDEEEDTSDIYSTSYRDGMEDSRII